MCTLSALRTDFLTIWPPEPADNFSERKQSPSIWGEIIMKRIIIASLVVLALGVTGCSVNSGSDSFTPDTGVELPDDDPTNPFEIEPVEETDDEVVVEDDDPVVEGEDDPIGPGNEEEGIFEMQTEADDVLTEVEKGTYYEQTFRMVDKNRDYSWSVTGLPENTGLSLEEDADSWRYSLQGTPVMADLGTNQITVTVVDANDSSKSTSISFDLTVTSGVGTLEAAEVVDPCSLPLRIVVEGFGGHVDHEILNDGKFRAKIDSDANIKLRVVRGYPNRLGAVGSKTVIANTGEVPPVGEVKWTWKSKVRNSHHCRPVYRHDGDDLGGGWGDYKNDHGNKASDQDRYVYSWASPNRNSCKGRYGSEADSEWRVTKNPTWKASTLGVINTNTAQAPGSVLNLSGKIRYDGPLPVKDLPLDKDAVEVIEVTATDGCSAGGGINLIATKTLEIGIIYPINGEGGRIEDVEVEMDFEDVRNYWESGYYYDNPHLLDSMEPGASPSMEVDCDDYEFKAICDSDSKFVMLFKGGSDFSDEAWEEFEGPWNLLPAIKESMGHVFYDFTQCDEDPDSCEERFVDHLNVPGQSKSLRDVQQIYLWWVVPPKIAGPDTHYADFDIKEIELKTRYWYAEFDDELNDFDNNITKDYVRSSCLTNRERFPGMSPASRITNRSGYRGVFRRRELAGYIPTP